VSLLLLSVLTGFSYGEPENIGRMLTASRAIYDPKMGFAVALLIGIACLLTYLYTRFVQSNVGWNLIITPRILNHEGRPKT
jgi:hypothetical protein